MHNVIFAFVGPSGSGKSTIIAEMLRRFPDRLGVIRSVTTRAKRSAEDDLNYRFLTRDEFAALRVAGRLIQGVEYAGQFYGNDRTDADEVFSSGRQGLIALVEDGIVNFRNAGYRVAMIRIMPVGDYDGRSEERRLADAERARKGPLPDIEIENDFARGGLDRAVNAAADFIQGYLDGLSTQPPNCS